MSAPPKPPNGAKVLTWQGRADFARQRAEWRVRVLKSADLLPSEKVVLCLLAEYFSADKPDAWPGIVTLADDSKMSERSVKGGLARGEATGFIERVRGNVGKTNRYKLSLPPFAVGQQIAPHEDAVGQSGVVASGNLASSRGAAGCPRTLSENPTREPQEVPSGELDDGASAFPVDGLSDEEKGKSVTANDAPPRQAPSVENKKEVPLPPIAQSEAERRQAYARRQEEEQRRTWARKAAGLRQNAQFVEDVGPELWPYLTDMVLANIQDAIDRDETLSPTCLGWWDQARKCAVDLRRDEEAIEREFACLGEERLERLRAQIRAAGSVSRAGDAIKAARMAAADIALQPEKRIEA